MVKHLLVYLTALFFSDVSAQNLAGSHTMYQYTTENGLPSNLIRGIQWDTTTGFLWIITESGLVRFNGVEFKSYIKEKISPFAPEKQVFAIRNNNGAIFISDGSGNIFEIKKNKPVLAKTSQESKSFINYAFIGVADNFFTAQIKFPPAFPEPFEKILSLNDTSCLVLFKNSIYLFGISNPAPRLIINSCTSLFEINGNCFFSDNRNRFFLLNKNSLNISPVHFAQPDNSLLSFQNGSSQLFWKNGMKKPVIIKDNEAWQLNYSQGIIEAALITPLLPTDANISTVDFLEEKGILFIGTDSRGLIVISKNKVFPKKRMNANPKNKNAYFSQIALNNGNILTNEGDIIGDNTGPYILPAKGKFSNRTSFTHGNMVWYNSTDTKSGIYCLHQFNSTTGTISAFTKIKPLTQVAVTGGKTYLANNEGIGLLQADSMYYLYHYPPGAANIKTYDFKELAPGELLVAGCQGLLKYTVSDNKIDTVYSRENACFGSIWKYRDYVFWGSYGYGYYVYKNGKIKEMPLDKNGYLLYCHCFVEDAGGNCWISTNRGLFKASLNDIITNFETGSTPVYYHYYGKKDGVEMTELNGGCTPCALILQDQTISFPTMDGLLWVNPQSAIPVLPEGEIFIDEFLVDNTPLEQPGPETEPIVPFKHDIQIELGFSAWCNKENIYIEYKLDNDKTWKLVNTDNGALIRFSNLASGNHTLYIRKLNGFGSNNYSTKEFRFVVHTPWHQQWWFYILSLLAALGLVLLYLGYRTRRYRIRQQKLEEQVTEKTKELQQQNEVLEKNNTIKTKLISIISHDIITPLKFLTVAGKNLLEKRKIMPEELQQETIQEITNTSQELQLLSTNILNWIKYQNENRRLTKETFNLHEMTGQVFGILQSLAKQKKLHLENLVDDTFEVHQYYEPLKILVYNLLTNAIHFTEKGTITVSAIKNNGMVTVMVKDEGIGMSEEQVQRLMEEHVVITSANVDIRKGHGLGYLIIKDLLKTMNATMNIESKKGGGTAVSITMEG